MSGRQALECCSASRTPIYHMNMKPDETRAAQAKHLGQGGTSMSQPFNPSFVCKF